MKPGRRSFLKNSIGYSVGTLAATLMGDKAALAWKDFVSRLQDTPGRSSLTGGTATVTVDLKNSLGIIDPRIFGHFTEETLTSYEGGVLSEMLYNRKFAISEDRNAKASPHLFTGACAGWEPLALASGVTIVVDEETYYSPPRSERLTYSGGDIPAGVQQKGYQYVMPQLKPSQRVDNPFRFRPGETYHVRLAIKSCGLKGPVHVALGGSYRNPVAHHAFELSGGEDWKVYKCELTPASEARDAKFMVYIDTPGTVWIDSVSMVRDDLDDGGFRKDVLEVTRRFKPTSIRWPGGWFVSDYHWMDGIGPRDKRPARLNRAWLGHTTNDMGIDEFVELCQKLNAEPYVCVNAETGSAEEAAALVEYANGGPHTHYGHLRAEYGHPQPYRIKAWNIGNEDYLPTLGGAQGSVYAKTYEALAKGMRAVDPTIELVAVGAFDLPSGIIPQDNPAYHVVRYLFDWNKKVLPVIGRDMTYYSIHDYAPQQDVRGLPADQINRAAMAKAENLQAHLERLYREMEGDAPGGKRYPIALDEWHTTLPNHLPPGAAPRLPEGMKSPSQIGLYGSQQTQRDAVAEAAVYNLMQRRPGEFALASRTILYAYSMGLVGIGRDQVVASPPALSLELYSTYDRCTSLGVKVKGPTFNAPSKGGFVGAQDAPVIDAAARLGSDGKTVEVFLVNRDLDKSVQTSLRISGRPIAGSAEMATLAASSLTEWNSFEHPGRVKIHYSHLSVADEQMQVSMSAHSISRITLHVQ